MRALSCLVLLVGCVVQPASSGTTPPPGGGGGGGAPAGQAIEAHCKYTGGELQGEIGSEFQVSCPANCGEGGVWGSEVYTADSSICRAGIHAGAISMTGGTVAVRLEAGRPAYRGSARNGIPSGDYGAYPKSFAVLNGTAATAPGAPAAGGQAIEAGCSYNATLIVAEVGTRHIVSCPSGCAASGSVWGSDFYTADSAVCRAAIHAGLLTDAGGTVGLVLEPGRPAYRGSTKNNIQSGDYGQFSKSFHLEKP